MKMQYILLLGLTLLLAYTPSMSQSWIKGTVETAKGEAIIGANIYLEDTYDGTSSDLDGRFIFQTAEKGAQTLVTSYLGFSDTRKSVDLSGDTLRITIVLKENAFELQNVVITAGAFEAGGEGKREVLRPLDILTTAGATGDIAGALNTLPGTQTVGESGRLFVRGGEGYETKTFIDGMQVMSFYSPAAPNTPGRSRFMPYMFSGTSFSTGGYSAEYGQALSSALILNSKFLATQNRTDISLMSVGADVGLTRAWDNTSLVGKVKYTNLDPYMGLIGQDIEWIDAPTSGEVSLAFRQKLSSTGILKLFGNYNRADFSLDRRDILDPSQKVRTDIGNQYLYLNGIVQESLGEDWTLRGGLSYTRSDDDIRLDESEVAQAEAGLHAKLILSKTFSNNTALKAGAEYFDRQFVQDYHQTTDIFTNRYDFHEKLGALFVESDIYLTSSLLARAGLRAEYSALNERFHLAPRLSLALKTSSKSQVSLAYGRFQQAADRRWLMVANDLGAEKADHYILNYQVSDKGRTFRTEIFQKDYRDLVKFLPGGGQLATDFSNTGLGYARGLELFWRDNKSLQNVDYWVSYSYLDTERNYQDFSAQVSPHFASKHNLSVVYKHFLNPIKSQIGFTYSFASGRPYDDPNATEFMQQRTPVYHDLSANLSYLFRQNIIIHLSASNVLGLDQVFGYEFANSTDEKGHYPSRAIRPPAKRFLFLGVFITLSKEKTMNQLPNL